MGCSHSGLVDEGLDLFHRMETVYSVEATTEHYACVVDLLGACRIHRNVALGEIAAYKLIRAEPHVASHYVLLSNIYSSTGLSDKATEVGRKMREMGVKKEPGHSWIEFDSKVHKLLVMDLSSSLISIPA